MILRLVQWVFTVWALASLLFLLTSTLPDEQQLLVRFSETVVGSETPSQEQAEAAQQLVKQRLGLTEPVFYFSPAIPKTSLGWRWQWNGTHNQYHRWLRALMHGNLGKSYRTEEAVSISLIEAIAVTVPLTCLATLCIIGISIPFGVWLAARSSSHWLYTALYVLDALPLFVVALLLLLLLANPDYFTFFPAFGLGFEENDSNATSILLRYPSFMVLPLSSLVLSGLTEPTLQLADVLRHEAQLDYMLTAQAKGLTRKQALWRHGLRNALLPIFTLFTELFPNLLAGSIVVEFVFALPGLGRLLADAAAARDYPVMLGGVFFVLLARQLMLSLADWLYQLADPRLRVSAS
ncbi:ABC transporter permease [Hymenobacter volaticus]|uniref:ABC transporter permease n=1 Tax=Hymenobacter volaticus TaxID=2932254 RepID=A0ABY4G3Z6_9BACT|nr:ABC transporter permease [Hymenobacter volaticus]UOQ65506.1 ABC transporter permease [Hymenobacter volaticus]